MCRLVLPVVLWLLIGTRSWLLVVGLLLIAEPLCPSRCLFRTILVTLCLMVWGQNQTGKSRTNAFLLASSALSFLSPTILVGVSQMDRVRNEEVRRRAGIEMELASRADQRVLRWFGHVE